MILNLRRKRTTNKKEKKKTKEGWNLRIELKDSGGNGGGY